jgi:hypothetical protein
MNISTSNKNRIDYTAAEQSVQWMVGILRVL